MSFFISDPRDPIKYNPIFREYYIKSFTEVDIITRHTTTSFLYCPWCGSKLPESLRVKFFDILKEEHDIGTSIWEYSYLKLPKEFRSEKWWKKRGL